MNDSFGDGWNGNILAFKQNNLILGTFGANFTKGNKSGPVSIVALGKFDIQIIVFSFNSRKTSEMGFNVTILSSPTKGTIIYQRAEGTSFTNDTIFFNFCPLGGCLSTTTLMITMTSQFG